MKSLGFILSYLSGPLRHRNVRVLAWLLLTFAVMVTTSSVVFHVLMAGEGRDHSWATGVYWTLTTMSTLGFGDITFESDAGRVFSVVVLVSGIAFILVLLPFTFIQFVFAPWMEHREAARAPRRLPEGTSGHILLTGLGAIEDALIRRAEHSNVPYVVLVADLQEASAAGTSLVGRALSEARLRERCNVNAIGVWERGAFRLAGPDTPITSTTVLILAGSAEQLARYDELFGVARDVEAPVVIIGGGRVGRAAGGVLEKAGVSHKIVEQRPERIRDPARYVLGDAAELEVLHRAGLQKASAVLITTHEDDMNVYLTLYCRRLEPDIQIIGRANLDRNVTTLHRAGADSVLSYASIGATAIWNTLGLNDTLVLAEGLDVFRVRVPASLVGRSLSECAIRQATGCNVVAIARNGDIESNPDADKPLPSDADLIVIGDSVSEQRFLSAFPTDRSGG